MNLKTFCITRNIQYREVCVTDLLFNKFYEIKNPEREQIVGIPDGCIDIQCIWKNGVPEIHVCGSFLEGAVSITGTYEKCIGIKFNPGAVCGCFQERMEEIVNSRCRLEDFCAYSEYLTDVLSLPLTLEKKIPFVYEIFQDERTTTQHEIVSYLMQQLQRYKGYISIQELMASLGYSQRYAERTFKNAVGFSIKKYAGIIKMQNALHMMIEEKNEESEIYSCLGYYDQAHFIHDFKKFTSLTPYLYRKNTQEIMIV